MNARKAVARRGPLAAAQGVRSIVTSRAADQEALTAGEHIVDGIARMITRELKEHMSTRRNEHPEVARATALLRSMFELVGVKIPPAWVVMSSKPGYLSLEPEAWSRAGFWERYFDGEPEAVAAFNEERAKIIAADP